MKSGEILKAVAMLLKKLRGEFETRADDLNKRVAALESHAAPSELRYCGVWSQGTEYRLGNFVTFKGALWHRNAGSAASRPGTDSSWTLAVKSGKE